MLTNTTDAKHVGRPACAGCGGTGFVYLWSMARGGGRAWFCDRGACKRFWSDAGRIALARESSVDVQALLPPASSADKRVLQPV
jgi:hypothetical protein